MVQKAITKYGLAFHLALLAAVPSSIAAFVSEQTLGGVVLWLSAFAALWIFIEPSIRPGEHLSMARARVCASVIRDPVVWFFLLYVFLAFVRWVNSGMEMSYDPEKVSWTVSDPPLPFFPGSAGDAGFLPFSIAVGGLVLVAGICHAIGLGARTSFALTGSFVTGLGGLVAAAFACAGVEPFCAESMQTLGAMQTPPAGTLFGIWLFIAIGAGVLAEARKWHRGRPFLVVAIGGNVAGVLFFAIPIVAAAFLLLSLLFFIFCVIWLSRVSSAGSMARNFVFTVLGVLLPIFLVMSFSSSDFKKGKIEQLNPLTVWNDEVARTRKTLSDVSTRLWLADPWRGAGLGAFKLKVQFHINGDEWNVLPPKVERATNGYWMLLSERGNVMCGLFLIGLGLMLWAWCSRGAEAFISLWHNEDADAFAFACSPEVWLPIIIFPLLVAEGVFTPVLSAGTILLAVVAMLSLATASFPRRQVVDVPKEDN